MIIRADFHVHSGDDPYDHLSYSVFDAIHCAARRAVNCIAIADHGKCTWKQEYADFAGENNVLLIPAIEAQICKHDVIILNARKDAEEVKTFEDLRSYRALDNLCIAPHPFYPIKCALNELLEEHCDLFDAIEISSCYLSWHDMFNRRAREFAARHGLPLVCNSDAHGLWQIGNVWTEVEAEEFSVSAVLGAVRNGKTKPCCRPMTHFEFFRFFAMGDLPRAIRRVYRACTGKGEREPEAD